MPQRGCKSSVMPRADGAPSIRCHRCQTRALVVTGSSAFADDDNGRGSMPAVLRLFEDVLSSDTAVNLPALPRMLFIAHGFVAIGDRTLHDGEAAGSEGTVALKAGSGGAALWRWEMVAQDGGGVIAGAGVSSREKLTARLDSLPKGRSPAPRRQRRVSARRLRLSASPSGPRHPLSVRRRHPHRHARPLDLVRSRWRLVRKRPRPGIRAGRRPADAVHPHHDPAGSVSRQKLRRVSSRGRQGRSRRCSSTRCLLICRWRRHSGRAPR